MTAIVSLRLLGRLDGGRGEVLTGSSAFLSTAQLLGRSTVCSELFKFFHGPVLGQHEFDSC